ncbi:MAG TPA: pyridoxal phosphate-dependent aminotransferase [Enteractinococcus helveticum]|uniref:alanine transaminase n=1 Tax=Enteractinococcus helveticum TaxID=1837282 RepID=A0A921FPV3_9MICC|nr:pyridoxal phosphate-dependent aminotransferase [Enteractinococcus helveticum]HJF14957.1 pyridoxal phosphate-dependent aminotransferase [Enteractinococcus helveticum]
MPRTYRDIRQSSKLLNVRYDVRGPILEEAQRLEAAGQRIMRLNIGNPAPFGFEAPNEILKDMIANLPDAQGYSDSKGITSARRAVSQYYETEGVMDIRSDDVYIGNGVSEMITMVLQALLDDGDEVLIPAPDYPLWTGATTLSGGQALHYRTVEEEGWVPDLEHIESRVSERTKAIVIINPNNPTGAVYDRETLEGIFEIARRYGLVVLSDEIYEKILYEDAKHIHAASIADDVLVLTFSGLSKAYRVAGYRAGWVAVSGAKHRATDFLEGLTLLANMRMCANVPAQHVIQTALGGYQSINDLILPGGRLLEQRNVAMKLLREIPGVTVQEPHGALYLFPKLDQELYPIEDDESFVIELLRQQQILVSHGGAFNYADTDHFRLVTLPSVRQLTDGIGRIAEFLEDYRYRHAAL